MGLRGFLPPETPHSVPYRYAEGNGAHRLPSSVIYGPRAVILTANAGAHAELERLGLEEVPPGQAEEWLASWQESGEQDAISEDVQAYREQADAEGAEPDSDPEPAEDTEDAEAEKPAIPEERPEDYHDLQELAKAYGIDARQKGDVLWEKLREERTE